MPPTITKQTNTVHNKPIAPAGSVLSEVVSVSDLKDDYIKIVLYGQNRVGKTTLACQFPKPLLLIAFEPNKTGGAKSVKKVPGVSYVKVESSEKALRLAQELKGNTYFKTHVLDSATSYQDIFLKELLGLSDIPEQLSWGTVSQDIYRQRSEKTKEGLRPFLNLDANTVIIAKEKDHNPPTDQRNRLTRGMQTESYIAADLGGATVQWLHDACDYIARLYLEKEKRISQIEVDGKMMDVEEETGKVLRKLRTLYHPTYAAGFRSENPQCVPDYVVDPTFAKIEKIIKGEWRVGVDK